MKTPIGIVDDHQLFLKSLAMMLNSFNDYKVVIEALNGKELQDKITTLTTLPELILIDVDMPVMNGPATAAWLRNNYPAIKLIALSMNDSDKTIISMLKAGCCAYFLKDTHPNDLEKGLKEISTKGFSSTDVSSKNFRRLLMFEITTEPVIISAKEKEFLLLAAQDFTYKEISRKMFVTERAIEGYRESLFEKLKVHTRIGLVMEALRRNMIPL